MRIENNITQNGFFWMPDTPDIKVPGHLEISDGGIITLNIFGSLFKELLYNNTLFDSRKKLRIHGNVETHGNITLDNCVYTQMKLTVSNIHSFTFSAQIVFLGYLYNNDDKILYNRFRFTIEGLDKWINTSGIDFKYNKQYKSGIIQYQELEPITIKLENEMSLSILFFVNHSLTLNTDSEVYIKEKVFFELYSEKATHFEDFDIIAHKLNKLICFALNEIVSIQKISADNNSIIEDHQDSGQTLKNIIIIYQSNLFQNKIPQINIHEALFNYSKIKNRYQRFINQWIKLSKVFNPALSLFLSVKSNNYKSSNSKFLALVQALETFHRRLNPNKKLMDDNEYEKLSTTLRSLCPKNYLSWLDNKIKYGNEVSLRNRLKDISRDIKKITGYEVEKKIIGRITDTRNYYTHYNKSLEEKISRGEELHNLCENMEAMFQLLLLRFLGFDESEIKELIMKYGDTSWLGKKLKSK